MDISYWNENWSPGLPHHNRLRNPLFLKRIYVIDTLLVCWYLIFIAS